MKIDFTKVKGLDPIPVGWYQGSIVKAEETVSKSSNNPMINVQWKIEGGKFDGRVIFDSLVFAENTLWRVKRTLQALGYANDFKGDVIPDELVGKSADLQVEIQESEGSDENGDPYPARNRVKRIRALGSGETTADDLV